MISIAIGKGKFPMENGGNNYIMILETKVIESEKIYQMLSPKEKDRDKKIERILRKLVEKNLKKRYDVVVILPPSWSIDPIEIYAKDKIIEKISKLFERCGLEYEILKVKNEIKKMLVDLDISSIKWLLKEIN